MLFDITEEKEMGSNVALVWPCSRERRCAAIVDRVSSGGTTPLARSP